MKKSSAGGVLTPHNLPYQMRLLVQLLARRFQDTIAPYNLTPLHWGILSCLWRQDGLMTHSIAAQLEQLGGTLTVGLTSMEKRKLVRRRPDRRDRRISRVWLTKRGAALQQEVVPAVEAFVGRVFACLSEKEVDQLSELIGRLKAHAAELG
jgi:DNA-binding MarR family transcriptional regulator